LIVANTALKTFQRLLTSRQARMLAAALLMTIAGSIRGDRR